MKRLFTILFAVQAAFAFAQPLAWRTKDGTVYSVEGKSRNEVDATKHGQHPKHTADHEAEGSESEQVPMHFLKKAMTLVDARLVEEGLKSPDGEPPLTDLEWEDFQSNRKRFNEQFIRSLHRMRFLIGFTSKMKKRGLLRLFSQDAPGALSSTQEGTQIIQEALGHFDSSLHKFPTYTAIATRMGIQISPFAGGLAMFLHKGFGRALSLSLLSDYDFDRKSLGFRLALDFEKDLIVIPGSVGVGAGAKFMAYIANSSDGKDTGVHYYPLIIPGWAVFRNSIAFGPSPGAFLSTPPLIIAAKVNRVPLTPVRIPLAIPFQKSLMALVKRNPKPPALQQIPVPAQMKPMVSELPAPKKQCPELGPLLTLNSPESDHRPASEALPTDLPTQFPQ